MRLIVKSLKFITIRRRAESIMITLKNIERDGNTIMADAFPEDCKTAVRFVCHIDTWELEEYVLPKGYEYCDHHMAMAKWHLKRLLDSNEELPKERLVMWY